GEQSMLAVEEQHDERFVRQIGQRETQVIADRFGRCENAARTNLLREKSSSELYACLELRDLGGTDAAALRLGSAQRAPHAREIAMLRQQVARHLERRCAADPDAQQDSEQFRVSEDAWAVRKEALARSFSRGPYVDVHDGAQCRA